ncbi:MAG: DUF4058 family protein [Anaerolineae bacterium]|nr:DUF4058 family protein [Anaerolineae bacterium]
MPSPFPGMDPYLEAPELWSGVHQWLISQIGIQLMPKLRPTYIAWLETRVEIGPTGDVFPVRQYPSEAIATPLERAVWERTRRNGSKDTAPLELDTEVNSKMTIAAIHIRRASDQRTVTAIEVLSPINKRPGNEAYFTYRRKRAALLDTNVHLVEIDLLRAGARAPMADPLPPAPYFIISSRADRRPRCEVWPIALADPLPTVPVPLLEGDPDVWLDLGQVLDTIYDAGGYGLALDYACSPPGPLAEKDAIWVNSVLNEQGLRRYGAMLTRSALSRKVSQR